MEAGKRGSRREVLVLIPGREVGQGRGWGTRDPFQTPAVQAGSRGREGGAGAARSGAWDRTRTWSVSTVTRMGQAASVFHRKLTTHSQLRENMGWVC